MSNEPMPGWLEEMTRRDALRKAIAGGAALSATGLLAACGGSDSSGGGAASTGNSGSSAGAKLRAGGVLRVGATGGGAKDTIDAQGPVADPDIMRVWNLYEPLAVRSPDFSKLEMLLAESIEPVGKDPDNWTIRLKDGITFHNGKTVEADDVIFSLRRIVDKKNPKVGAASLNYIDADGMKKLDAPTRASRTTSDSTSTPSFRPITTRRSPSARGRSSTRASRLASAASLSRTRTTGSRASRGSTSS